MLSSVPMVAAVSGLGTMLDSGTMISVIIPLHNKAQYVTETLNSLLSQSHTNWQAIVVENGSTDCGVKKVLQFHDQRITLLIAPDDVRGPGAARNLGLQTVAGEWVLFLDADDLIETDHLSNLLRVAIANPGADVVAGGWQTFQMGSSANRQLHWPPPSAHLLTDSAIASAPWAVHAAIVKRTIFDRVHWPAEMDSMLAEDNHFWFQVCRIGNVVFGTSSNALYRQATPDCRNQVKDIQKWFSGVHAAVEKNVGLLRQDCIEPNYCQAANLMQLYVNLYRQAKIARDVEYMEKSLKQAEHWLNHFFKTQDHKYSFSIIIRRLIGIAWTERLRAIYSVFQN